MPWKNSVFGQLVEGTEGEAFSASFINPTKNPLSDQLVEGTEGETFSASFTNQTRVSGAFEDPSRPDSLDSAPPLLSSTSGHSGSSAQGPRNYPGTDSGLALEDAGYAEVGSTVIQSQGDKGNDEEGKGEEEEVEDEEIEDDDMDLDESVMDESEHEEAEYDSSVSLDY